MEWVRERFERVAFKRLENYRPVIEQMNEWQMPIVVSADD